MLETSAEIKVFLGLALVSKNRLGKLINQDVHPFDNLQDGEAGAENVDALAKANSAGRC